MRIRHIAAGILAVSMGLTSACGSSDGAEKSVGFELSEEEMELEHLQIELTDEIAVDAEITQYHAYADGLNSYYINFHKDITDICDSSEIRDSFTMFGHDPNTLLDLLKEQIHAEFVYSPDEILLYDSPGNDYVTVALYLEDQSSSGLKLSYMNWWDRTEAVYNPQSICGSSESDSGNRARDLLNFYPSFNRQNLAFGDISEIGDMLKEWLEKILQEELYQKYECAVLSRENCDQFLDPSEYSELSRESYVYFFERCVDGFPWKCFPAVTELTEDMNLSEDVSGQVFANEIVTHPEYAQMAEYTEDGVIQLELNCFNDISEIYQKQKAVADLNTVLSNVQSYYENQLVLSQITIVNIELCYASSFSDAEDGEICNIVKPFWAVICRDESQGKTFTLQFDGYTGEFVQETGYVM